MYQFTVCGWKMIDVKPQFSYNTTIYKNYYTNIFLLMLNYDEE